MSRSLGPFRLHVMSSAWPARGENRDDLAAAFEALRPYLRRVAYAVLGSLAEADDVVQDAWLRLQRIDPTAIEDLRAYLTQVTARRALDVLGSARVRRETYAGPWLPEPVVDEPGPAEQVTLDETISMALLVVLERLSPAERTAFVLHDVFGYSFADVATTVGRSPAAVRQLASRARRHVEEHGARFNPSPAEHREVLAAFMAALEGGAVDDLLAVLDPDVVMLSDGGGVVNTSRKPLRGAPRVARVLLAARFGDKHLQRQATVNGLAGIVGREVATGVVTILSFTVRDGRITRIDVLRNPEKFTGVAPGLLQP